MNERTSVRTPFGLAVLLAVSIAMIAILLPFWQPMFWAVVMAILFWPLRQRMIDQLGWNATVAALAILLLIFTFVLVPTLILIGMIAQGAAAVVGNIRSGTFKPMAFLEALPERFPGVNEYLERLGVDLTQIDEQLRSVVLNLGEFAMSQLLAIGQGASVFAFQAFIFFYLGFAALAAGPRLYRAMLDTIPAPEEAKENFFKSFATMSVATIRGTVVVGLVQGTLGGLAFWFLGIEGAVFWGAMMGLLSVIPPFGAGFVWAPAALILIATGSWAEGLGLMVYGAVIISSSDNFVRPYVVGRATSLPDFLVLLTTLGGLSGFGLTGLVLGPVVAALFVTVWTIYRDDITRISGVEVSSHEGAADPED